MAEKNYSLDLLTIKTEDGFPLDGLLYRPKSQKASEAALIFLHGKTGNFYGGPGRFLPPMLIDSGYSSFSMNMRIHDLGYTRYDLPFHLSPGEFNFAGGAWEIIENGHKDIGAGVGFLISLGYKKIILAGHSSGGFYSIDYAGGCGDVHGLILLSPLTTNKTMLPRWFRSEKEFEETKAHAEKLIASGRGHILLPLDEWYYAISASSFIDRISEKEGHFQESIKRAKVPIMVLYGGAEDRAPIWKKLYEELDNPEKELAAIEGSEHMYVGFEREVCAAVKKFLGKYFAG